VQTKFEIDKEVQIAFDLISRIPASKPEPTPTLVPYKAPSSEKEVIGRTFWDLLATAWAQFKWWSLPIAALVLVCLVAIAHFQTEPGKSVALFGLPLYTKGGVTNPSPPTAINPKLPSSAPPAAGQAN